MAQVILKNIKKTFLRGKIKALQGINLEIPHGKFLTILGPSGCGKSTLLRIIAGLEKPEEGQIIIGNKIVNDLPPAKRNIAMVFQNYALYPHMKVEDNIAISLKIRKYPAKEITKRVYKVSEMLGIKDLLSRYPSQLSGGQQQRVALARALVREPEVFLLDEPLSNLDAQIREQTRTELKRLFKELNATVIYVTHDQLEAMTMPDILAVMHQGKIIQVGSPEEIYKNPNHRFVAEFVGLYRINMIKGCIKDKTFISEDKSLKFPVNIPYSGKAIAGIRPEILELEETKDCFFFGKLIHIEPLGHVRIAFIKIGNLEFKVLVKTKRTLHIGDELKVSFSSKDIYFFEEATGRRL